MSAEIVEDLVSGLSTDIRALAPELAKTSIEQGDVDAIVTHLHNEVAAMAGDLRILLAAKGASGRRFKLGAARVELPQTNVGFPPPSIPAPVERVGQAIGASTAGLPTPDQRARFEGRLVGTKEPVLAAAPPQPRPEPKDHDDSGVDFISDTE